MATLEGLHPTLMRPRVEALLADPEARRLGLYLVSGFRSIEHQERLWKDALRRYGDPEIADNWVARPGQSNHGPRFEGYGTAVDLGVPGLQAVKGQWPAHIEKAVNLVAEKHGLYSPMNWEDWHFEPIKNWIPPKEKKAMADQDHQYEAIRRNTDGAIALVAPGFFKHIDDERWEYAKANNKCQIEPREVNERGWDLERDIVWGGEEPEAQRKED